MTSYYIDRLLLILDDAREEHHLSMGFGRPKTTNPFQLSVNLKLTNFYHHLTFTSQRSTSTKTIIDLSPIPDLNATYYPANRLTSRQHQDFAWRVDVFTNLLILTSKAITFEQIPDHLVAMIKEADKAIYNYPPD